MLLKLVQNACEFAVVVSVTLLERAYERRVCFSERENTWTEKKRSGKRREVFPKQRNIMRKKSVAGDRQLEWREYRKFCRIGRWSTLNVCLFFKRTQNQSEVAIHGGSTHTHKRFGYSKWSTHHKETGA